MIVPMIHSTQPKFIHLVHLNRGSAAPPEALCGTALPSRRVEVVLPHDDPKACKACLEKHAEDKADPHAPIAPVPSPQMW
jgi:hypothetical protein